jgi:hypothetical protein
MKRPFLALLLSALLLAAGFAAGRATAHPAAPPAIPIAEPAEHEVTPAHADTERACKNDLVEVKAQLAICLAFRGSPEACAPTPPTPSPDELTARLVRTHTTNSEVVFVRDADGRRFVYPPGKWPPPEGPWPGSRIVARGIDGGMEYYAEDGGVRVVPDPVPDPSARPVWGPPPCPRQAPDGG